MASTPYPAIGDYALISDCHSAALVSRSASIDWCCMPRLDGGSCFGRLLDWGCGGYCSVEAEGGEASGRRYLDGTLVLETMLAAGGGEARVLDCLTMREGGRERPRNQLLRVIEGVRGRVDLRVELVARFDYGEVRPWLRRTGRSTHQAIGGNDGLLIQSDFDLEPRDHHDLVAQVTVRAEERLRLSIAFVRPELLEPGEDRPIPTADLDARLEETLDWWRRWSAAGGLPGPDAPGALRSALIVKGLQNAPTGAIAAAATTSLPESPGGSRNWDYRYSWIRDSTLSVRALAALGFDQEADGFRRFIERSAAGSADDLQIAYGLGGERRLTEIELGLEGYRGASPVRIGNGAVKQVQLDAYGHLLELAWRWHERGHSPDDDYWRFLVELVETAADRWSDPDRGIWEVRGEPQHFVHSKAMCWVALDRGLRLAEECMRRAPLRRWQRARAALRREVEKRGYDRGRNTFLRAFGADEVDAALLLLPRMGFVDWGDERMRGTVDAVREELERDGLVWRYRSHDGLEGEEGAFLACSFWLVECLAHQGRGDEARDVFDRAVACGNDLGLFSEEFDPGEGQMLGNFPQALTHLSHIAAAAALSGRAARDV